MSIIGSSNSTVTLSPSMPDVVIEGVINAIAPIGRYLVTNGYQVQKSIDEVYTAIFGPSDGSFSLLNTGIIETAGANESLDAGIVLANPGIVRNEGTIIGGSGILEFNPIGYGYKTGAGYAQNSGVIEAAAGDGIFIQNLGGANNSGAITAANIGIYLPAGNITNAGTVLAKIALDARKGGYRGGNYLGQIYNTGFASGSSYGVFTVGTTLNNAASGTIEGGTAAISLMGTAYNSGIISGGKFGIFLANFGHIYNYNSISGATAGIYDGEFQPYPSDIGNYAGARITGGHYGVELITSNRIYNYGYIGGGIGNPNPSLATRLGTYGASNAGLVLQASGNVYNAGTIAGGATAIFALNNYTEVYNTGIILSGGVGITGAAGHIYNFGTIYGAQRAISYAGNEIYNYKMISGGSYGVFGAGSVLNYAPGTVTGHTAIGFVGGVYNSGLIRATGGLGVSITGYGFVLNRGLIESTIAGANGGIGVELNDTANFAFFNRLINTGTIIGIADGVSISNGGNVTDSGTIIGLDGTAMYFSPSAQINFLTITPSAKFIGDVTLNGTLFLPDITHKTDKVTLSQFVNVETIVVGTAANWDFLGESTMGAGTDIVNNGTIEAAGHHHLTIDGNLEGGGTIKIGPGGLALNGEAFTGFFAVEQTIAFSGSGEKLSLGNAGLFEGTIQNFRSGDTIILPNLPVADIGSSTFGNGILTIQAPSQTTYLHFAHGSNFANETFTLFNDGGGTGIVLQSTAPAAMRFLKPAAASAAPATSPPPTAAYTLNPPLHGVVSGRYAATGQSSGWLTTNPALAPPATQPWVTLQSA